MARTWLGGVVGLLAGVALVATACGSGGSSSAERGPLISSDQVMKLLYRGAQPRRIGGLVPLGNLQSQPLLPDGDLAEYEFFRAGGAGPGHADLNSDLASLTVFGDVAAARAASLAIHRGGSCVPHPLDKNSFALWSKCEHLRVGNVLLIISLKDNINPGVRPRDRQALLNTLRKLGKPTDA